jgi:hypothetical protein
MPEKAELKPYHQSRWVCLRHGFFDVWLHEKPLEGFRARCPDCEKPAEAREGYECTGKTTRDIPHRSKPRLDEMPEIEVILCSDTAKVIKKRSGYYDRHEKSWKQMKR